MNKYINIDFSFIYIWVDTNHPLLCLVRGFTLDPVICVWIRTAQSTFTTLYKLRHVFTAVGSSQKGEKRLNICKVCVFCLKTIIDSKGNYLDETDPGKKVIPFLKIRSFVCSRHVTRPSDRFIFLHIFFK